MTNRRRHHYSNKSTKFSTVRCLLLVSCLLRVITNGVVVVNNDDDDKNDDNEVIKNEVKMMMMDQSSSAQASTKTTTTTRQRYRSLQQQQQTDNTDNDDDWTMFNDWYSNAVLYLPDATASPGSSLTLDFTNLKCRNIRIDDMQLTRDTNTNTTISTTLRMDGIQLSCTTNYRYRALLGINGGGTADILVQNSHVATQVILQTDTSWAQDPPTTFVVRDCQRNIKVTDMDFDGNGSVGIVGWILNAIEKSLRDVVEREMGDFLCQALDQIDDNAGQLLMRLTNLLAPYVNLDTPLAIADPLQVEQQLQLSLDDSATTNTNTAVSLVSWQQQQSSPNNSSNDNDVSSPMAQALQGGLTQLSNFLSGRTENGDLRINQILSDQLLLGSSSDDGNGGFELDFSSSASSDATLIMSQVVSTVAGDLRLELQRATIFGLDSFSRFDPLEAIGRYTLQGGFRLDSLRVVIQVQLVLSTPTSDNNNNNADATTTTQPQTLVQTVDVTIPLERLEAETAVLLAIDADTLGSLPLGLFLQPNSTEMVGCLLQSVHDLQITQLRFMQPIAFSKAPSVSGFSIPGLERVVGGAVRTLFDAFYQTMSLALTNFVQTTAVSLLDDTWRSIQADAICDTTTTTTNMSSPNILDNDAANHVDLRDLLLEPGSALKFGGSGTNRYGSIGVALKDALDKELLATDANGLSRMNELLVRPATTQQSGTPGTFALTGDLVQLNASVPELEWGVTARVGQLQVRNLDTLRQPIGLVDPIPDEAYRLNNSLTVGLDTQPLGVSAEFEIGMWSGVPAQPTVVKVAIGMEADSVTVLLKLMAKVVEQEFLAVPLGTVLDISGWTADLAESLSLDSNGTWIDNNLLTLAFQDLGVSTQGLDFTFECLECPNTGGSNNVLARNTDLATADPLAVEQALVVPDDVELLDFQEPSTQFSGAIDAVLTEVSGFLGSTADDGDLTINQLLREQVLTDGKLNLDTLVFSDQQVLVSADTVAGNFGIVLKSATVHGLDSFSKFSPLVQIGKHTLQSDFAIENIVVEISLEVFLDTPPPVERSVREQVLISVPMDKIEASTALLLAIDEGRLGSLPLGSLLDDSLVVDCILTAVHHVQVTSLQLSPFGIGAPSITGLSSPALQSLVDQAIDALYEGFHQTLSSTLTNFIQTTAVDFLDEAWQDLKNSTNCETDVIKGTGNEFVDFRDLLLTPDVAKEYGGAGDSPYGKLAAFFKQFVDNELAGTDSSGRPNINSLVIQPLTENSSGEIGTLSFDQDFFDIDNRIAFNGLDARVQIQVGQLQIRNLDSLRQPLAVLDPVRGDGHIVNNTVTIAENDRPLTISAIVSVGLETESTTILNKVELGIELSSVSVLLNLMALVSEERFLSFPLEDILDFHCWAATIPAPQLNDQGERLRGVAASLSLRDLEMLATGLKFTLSCIECTSPLVTEIESMLQTEQGQADAERSAQNVIDYLVSTTRGDTSFMQTRIDRFLVEAPKKCRHSPEFSPNSKPTEYSAFRVQPANDNSLDFLLGIIVATLCALCGTVLIVIVVKVLVGRRNRRWLGSLEESRVDAIYAQQQENEAKRRSIDIHSNSLFSSEQVPRVLRWLMPVVLVANIALFLSGHFSIGGSVRIYLNLAGESIVFDDFYTFSVAQSALELWDAGGKELAILILLFSGVWPYAKLITTIFLWFAPPTSVPVARRGSILEWLDALAKWSMIDVFVMIISMVAFRVTIQSPSQSFLPEDLYRVDLVLVPLWGLYANMTAQLVAQFSSHAIIYYHRRVERDAARSASSIRTDLGKVAPVITSIDSLASNSYDNEDVSNNNESGLIDDVSLAGHNGDRRLSGEPLSYSESNSSNADEKAVLNQQEFKRPHRGDAERLVLRSGVNVGFLLASVLLAILVLSGTILPTFSFDSLGLVGIAIETGQDFVGATMEYSVFTIARLLTDQSRFLDTGKDYVGLFSIAIIMVLTAVVTPLIQLCLLMIQWLYPLSLHQRKRVTAAIEVLQAWQYMDVYLLSIVVGAWQLPEVSAFLIGSECDGLKNTFAELVYYGFLSPEDGQCFKVQASIEEGSYILIGATVLLTILTTMVTKASAQYRLLDNKTTIASTPSVTVDSDAVAPETDIDDIAPVPIMFTDRYRWLLTSSIGSCVDATSDETKLVHEISMSATGSTTIA